MYIANPPIKVHVKYWQCLLAAVFLLANNANSLACEHVHRAVELPPYAIKTLNGQWRGSDIEIMREITRVLKCKFVVLEMPFARALKMLEKGVIDSMSQLSKVDDRLSYTYFIGPINFEILRVITFADVNDITNIKDILNMEGRLAIQRGIYVSEEFHRLFRDPKLFQRKFIEMTDPSLAPTLVSRERATGFIMEQNHYRHLLATEIRFKRYKLQPIILNKEPLYLGLSKRNYSPEQLALISAEFESKQQFVKQTLRRYHIN